MKKGLKQKIEELKHEMVGTESVKFQMGIYNEALDEAIAELNKTIAEIENLLKVVLYCGDSLDQLSHDKSLSYDTKVKLNKIAKKLWESRDEVLKALDSKHYENQAKDFMNTCKKLGVKPDSKRKVK